MRRVAVLSTLIMIALGCSSTTGTNKHGAAAARPTLPRIHEGFTLLQCPHKGPARRTTVGLEGCAEHEILRTDRHIVVSERAILSRLPANGQSAFASAERSWLAYREAYCNARASSYTGGSIAPVIFASCQAAINKNHVRTLSVFRRELRRR